MRKARLQQVYYEQLHNSSTTDLYQTFIFRFAELCKEAVLLPSRACRAVSWSNVIRQ